ncbi:MAG: TrkH family potassium uptake protein [Marinosulfonomonas sp.]|nr:TrkH family potassium uptake protein [Marinosulfonomonas sp.]
MLARILKLPFFVVLMGLAGASMLLPALHASFTGDHFVARAYGYSAVLFLVLTAFIGLATDNQKPGNLGRNHLLAMFAAFIGLPAMLAVPFNIAVGDTTFLNSYVEMVSCFTTTGATLFDDPARLPASVHLWRALVGWLGGFLVLVTAVSILAPLNLGGFEVLAPLNNRRKSSGNKNVVWTPDGAHRLQRFGARLFPIYAGLTFGLWIILLLLGDTPLIAVSHAMSVLATSGISPVGGLENSGSGVGGEIAVFAFLFFALSRQTFMSDKSDGSIAQLKSDPEFRIAILCVVAVPLLLFGRHWLGAYEVEEVANVGGAVAALWGGVFTVLSFLSTTGFESAAWATAREWSGLATPGIILMGLALIGGGVATTAGGVKLLRVYALYKHGVREMDRLVHPSSVGGAGSAARRLRRQGAYVAWVFFMLFALSLALVTLALSLTGLDFQSAMIHTVAALSTTGPIVSVAGDDVLAMSALNSAAKLILSGAMVLGRLEMLAIIALLNPDFWRA